MFDSVYVRQFSFLCISDSVHVNLYSWQCLCLTVFIKSKYDLIASVTLS